MSQHFRETARHFGKCLSTLLDSVGLRSSGDTKSFHKVNTATKWADGFHRYRHQSILGLLLPSAKARLGVRQLVSLDPSRSVHHRRLLTSRRLARTVPTARLALGLEGT